MTRAAEPSELPQPGIHRGREHCRALLRQALIDLAGTAVPSAGAARPALREAWLVDRQFGEWPLDDPAVLDSLSAWLRPGGGRCLHIVGLDFEATARALPRFARWRRDWAHAVDARRPAEGVPMPPLRGLLAGSLVWQWLDAPDFRLRLITNPVHWRAAQEQLADFLQQCEPAWPVTTLGL